MEENNEGTSAEKDGLKKKAKAIKAAEGGEKRKSLMQILTEKKALKNKNPLYSTEKKRKREETLPDSFSDSDEDGGVVPQKMYDDINIKYRQLQRKHQALTNDLDQCKQKSTELENGKSELEQEVVTYREANLTLQHNIDKLLKEIFSQRSETSRTCEPAIPPLTPPGQNTTSEREPDQPIHGPRQMEIKDGKIHIGTDIWLREEVWRKIDSTTKDSLFVKELAVAIWGTAELMGRSVSGKECPGKTIEAKPPLTPCKLGTLKECFRGWLTKQNVEKTEREKREKLAGYFISQKMQDLVKSGKKQSK
ncbi:hypothetical protein OYC64_020122 [Pagothenia borchgrevinki]|uniref:BEN domain-containing protein n=1 Tax=Pagothenia borchgrevinki TaxID=8213 RepID=A0ABD2FK37_PAGBO